MKLGGELFGKILLPKHNLKHIIKMCFRQIYVKRELENINSYYFETLYLFKQLELKAHKNTSIFSFNQNCTFQLQTLYQLNCYILLVYPSMAYNIY